ncbi:Double-strand break repair protein MRE11 [Ceratobasidium theobromae]|uniref:Double-strand break repair protein n=1 Tax=Ceratobasidium theobromae TaxID=1582974 RepID=A0A5N5QDP2_9AGAM|nr:Double-strand break repair protein MRE11 [Ceratobasidium theobromae]
MSVAERDEHAPLPPISDELPEDTIKIMLATDNHIGYNERDPIRGQDAMNTFKEVLELARKHDVDFILLAGDLFHENRPSRDCLYRTIALLREYTFGDKPVQVELLSDPDEGKADGFSFPAINYEDFNLNVGIPVFSIHGNHDDPQGAGPDGALCALDVLSVAGVINYIGKSDLSASDDPNAGIQIKPVLLRKGATQLALYGVGNVKDQRMHFELRSNRVKMFMPKDKDNWFNILLVHQNRCVYPDPQVLYRNVNALSVKRGPLEAVPEGMFDDSINLVVWGHEHDCRIVPEPVAGKEYFITQPGSSVATSLADGEAIPKHVGLLEIQHNTFQLTPIPLRTVRPFVLDEVNLMEASETDGLDTTNQVAVMKFLRERVNALIDQAREEWQERNEEAGISPADAGEMMLPLVETTGVSVMSNPVRFSQEFIGRVANPRDVLVFHRAKTMTRGAKVVADEPELSIDDPTIPAAEKLQKVRVQNLVREYLAAQELQLLGELGMSDAIQTFVEKDENRSISEFVNNSLKAYEKKINGRKDIHEANLDDALYEIKEEHAKEYEETQLGQVPTKPKGKARANEGSDAGSVDSMEVDDSLLEGARGGNEEFSEDEPAPPPKKATTSRATKASSTKAAAKPAAKSTAKAPAKGKGRGKQLFAPASDDDDAEIIEMPEEDEDESEPEPPPKPKGRAGVLSGATKKAPAKKAATGTTKSRQTKLTVGSSQASTRAPRAAAKSARSKVQAAIELSD